jgi:hypothetical protein
VTARPPAMCPLVGGDCTMLYIVLPLPDRPHTTVHVRCLSHSPQPCWAIPCQGERVPLQLRLYLHCYLSQPEVNHEILESNSSVSWQRSRLSGHVTVRPSCSLLVLCRLQQQNMYSNQCSRRSTNEMQRKRPRGYFLRGEGL